MVESVASVGIANAGRLGIQGAGDYVSATDNAVVDQSVNTTETNSTVTTTTSSLDTNLTTYDATDDGFIVNGNYDYNYTTDSTVTYGGQETTLGWGFFNIYRAWASHIH